MPKTPSSGFYHQPFLWRVAGARMLIRCYCGWCRRAQHYLAMDLVPIFGSDAVVGRLWDAARAAANRIAGPSRSGCRPATTSATS